MSDNKDTICVIPWIHLNIIPRGKVYHCCMTTELKKYVGDLNEQTIEEVWNGEPMRKIRKDMINGVEPKACSKCFESERSSGRSNRLNQNKDFPEKFKQIPIITKEDGFVEEVDLRYWDFRFSNLCNFKCRSCGPEYSSSWLPDSIAIGWRKPEDNQKVLNVQSVDSATNVDFLKKYVNVVEKIYFAGGEPLLMDEHWQILEMLDEAKRYDVVLTYNTNLSKLTYQNKNVLDYWRKWGMRVWLWPSIDEIDDRAELIRSGTNWRVVEENLKEVTKIGIHVRPGITVSAMNIQRIPEILNRLLDIGVINEKERWANFSFNMVEHSPYFHVSILSDEIRKRVRERLEAWIVDHDTKYGTTIRTNFLHLFWHLEKPWQPELAKDFKKFTLTMDELRNENTLEVIPELQEVLE